jgi:glycosyltransferase involved in cell wall biosynthesis
MTTVCKISVIIPCFNHGEFLSETVTSVTGAKRDDLELIVVDDGSTDQRTREEVDALCGQGIRTIRQENKGVAAARNAAILASQGQYIFPLDADDHLRPGWIDQGIRILDSDPQVGVVYGDEEFFGTQTGRWHTGPFDLDRLLQFNYIPVSALYRRSVWEQNGGYDGTMPVQGFEDWDFWLGAFEHGWRFAYLPEIFIDYRRANESMLTHALGFNAQTEEFIAKKHGPLYRRVWLPYLQERRSVRLAFRHLARLLVARSKREFSRRLSSRS